MQSLQTTRPRSYQPMALCARQPGARMPKCRYDPWCNRQDCIYTHDSTPTPPPSKHVCLQFLQGQCVYNDHCWFQHPVDPSHTLAKLKTQPCQFGAQCPYGDGCLFGHLRTEASATIHSKNDSQPPNKKYVIIRKCRQQQHEDHKVPHQPSYQPSLSQSYSKALHPRGRSV